MAPPRIDTIRAGGKIESVNLAGPAWMLNVETGPDGCWMVHGRRRALAGGAMLDVGVGASGLTAWVEGSAAKVVHGVNYPGVTIGEAREVVASWMDEAARFVAWDEAPRVNRLDVVRDFEVGGRVQEVLAGVGGMRQGGRCTRAVYRDPSASHAMTVWARTKRMGGGRLYDKLAESGCAEAAGVVRFEAQERALSLRRVGVETLSALADTEAEAALARRWAWCGFGDRVLPVDRLVLAVMAREDWRLDTRFKLVGWVTAGYPDLRSRSTEYRYRTRLRSVGQLGTESDRGWRLDLVGGLVAA